MALMHCDFLSEVLELCVSMYVILPQPPRAEIERANPGRRYPTLYLFHGLSDDHSIWLRRTSIERYVEPLNLAVVMPAAHRSYYTDMTNGYRYWTFISEELPAAARFFFPLSADRQDNFAAGLSMGGYGAFKLALSHPDRYAAAASLSGALEVRSFAREAGAEGRCVFGPPRKVRGSSNDLYYLAHQVAQNARVCPRLYQCCGTEDFLYQDNVDFRDYALKLKLDLTYEEGPGEHEWGYWDQQIKRVLDWLPLCK